jgi:hypothetical protein
MRLGELDRVRQRIAYGLRQALSIPVHYEAARNVDRQRMLPLFEQLTDDIYGLANDIGHVDRRGPEV